jgi:hypothetical protein
MKDAFYETLTFTPFTVTYDEEHGLRTRSSECEALVRPGTVLRLKPPEERSDEHEDYPLTFVLVGNCNTILGLCDDCTGFDWEDIEAVAYLPGFDLKGFSKSMR